MTQVFQQGRKFRHSETIPAQSSYEKQPLFVTSISQSVRIEQLGCYSLRSGHSSILSAFNFQPAATREPDDLCGNQRYRRELLMMAIMFPETC